MSASVAWVRTWVRLANPQKYEQNQAARAVTLSASQAEIVWNFSIISILPIM
jgi:hypothetical protein